MMQAKLFEVEEKRTRTAPKVPSDSIKYRPSNGTEGDCFISEFCAKCKKFKYSKEIEDNYCPILDKTMVYGVDSKHYPKWWISDADGKNSRCLLFAKR